MDSYAGIVGVDEAGRGPLAGPVVAAAVMVYTAAQPPIPLADSKTLSSHERAELTTWLAQNAAVGIGMASVEEIDTHNILQATFLAMHRALENLRLRPKEIWVDGNAFKPWRAIRYRCIVKGDQYCLPISAASIIAKHIRDEWMKKAAYFFPIYGWEKNKGYPTTAHYEAIQKYGISPLHRKRFLKKLGI